MQNTVSFNAYNSIKQDIIFGNHKPSMKLKLNHLKEQYQTSVTILRETLNRLASEGFALMEGQRGFFVAPVSKEDLEEIADLRILLETRALKLSIENADANWEAGVIAAHHKLKLMEEMILKGNTSKMVQWKKSDWEFHHSLIQGCQSKNLLDIHSIVYDKYLRYQMQVLTFRGLAATEEHKGMLEAALNKDFGKAKDILTVHIQKGHKHSESFFQNA